MGVIKLSSFKYFILPPLVFVLALAMSSFSHAAAVKNQFLSQEKIVSQGKAFMVDQLPWDKDQMEVEVSFKGKGLRLPPGEVELKFDLPERAAKFGYMPLNLKVMLNGETHKVLRLKATASVYEDVVALNSDARKGNILTLDDLKLLRVKKTPSMRESFSDIGDAAGMELRRSLNAGHILTYRELEQPVLIKRGDRVLLVAESSLLKITAPGIAKGKGVEGTMIQVQNLETKKTVYGRIVDSRTVQIQLQ